MIFYYYGNTVHKDEIFKDLGLDYCEKRETKVVYLGYTKLHCLWKKPVSLIFCSV